MGFEFDFDPSRVDLNDTEKVFENRYFRIEAANDESWYMKDQPTPRPFDVYFSVHSAGAPRDPLAPLGFFAMNNLLIPSSRRILGGNVDPGVTHGPMDLDPSLRSQDARTNIDRICADAGIHAEQLHILNARLAGHDTNPLTPLNIDTLELTPNSLGLTSIPVVSDFICTHNPEVVLAATPADCPLLLATAETPQGAIYILIHYPWRGVANRYVEQTDRCFTELGVDRSTLRMYLSAGAHAENFLYQRPVNPRVEFPSVPELFQYIHAERTQDTPVWTFGIDTPHVVHAQLLELPGIEPWMLYTDTSDTGSVRSGYSSHTRASNQDPSHNTRDLLALVAHTNSSNSRLVVQ